MFSRKGPAQLPAGKLRRGMHLAFNGDDMTVEVLVAYRVMDVPGAPIWLELSNGDSGAVDADEVFTVCR